MQVRAIKAQLRDAYYFTKRMREEKEGEDTAIHCKIAPPLDQVDRLLDRLLLCHIQLISSCSLNEYH